MRPDSKIALYEPQSDDGLTQGLARSRSGDGDLFSLFNLSWSKDIDPLNVGELSSYDCENLLEKMRHREAFFEAQLALLPAQDAELLRKRYRVLRTFFASAVEHEQPIYLVE